MKWNDLVQQRSNGNCALCASTGPTTIYEIPPQTQPSADNCILLCGKCVSQIDKKEPLDSSHWQCLGTSMWSEFAPVQVMTWRLLNRLRQESWAMDHLDMMYLEEDLLSWAKASGDHENDDPLLLHKDANGNLLQTGDTIILTRSLDVKGSTLNAKMGTVVKNIRLVPENTEQIEGRIEGQTIVILTKYVRKQGA